MSISPTTRLGRTVRAAFDQDAPGSGARTSTSPADRSRSPLHDALVRRYCRAPAAGGPNDVSIGLELEFPLVTRSGNRREVTAPVVGRLCDALGLMPVQVTSAGEIVAARRPSSGAVIAYEYARSLLEISLPPGRCCLTLQRTVLHLLAEIGAALDPLGLELAFSGKHPQAWARREPALSTPHYAAVSDFLHRFGDGTEEDRAFVAYTASVQTHIGATSTTLPGLLEMLRDIGFVRALLLANSPSDARPFEALIERDGLWRDTAFGRLLARAPPVRLDAIEDVLAIEASKSIWCADRDGIRWVFEPIMLSDLVSNPVVAARGHDGIGSVAGRIRLELADLTTFRGYDDVVPTRYGTVEVRGDCQQPVDALLAPTALYVGLAARLEEAVSLVRSVVPAGTGPSLRRTAIGTGWAMGGTRPDLSIDAACSDILALAHDGLKLRGRGEETLLDPLYARLDRRTNPALDSLARMPLIDEDGSDG